MFWLATGPMADAGPTEWLLLGTGVLTAALGVAMLRNKPLLEAGATRPSRSAASANPTQH